MSKECSTEAKEVIEDLLHQFASDGDGMLWTRGLSALEAAFDYIGWDNPHPLEDELLCQDECGDRATCGTPTPEGYKRLCSDHYAQYVEKVLSMNAKEEK